MGANAVNSMCEFVAPLIENIAESKIGLKILSNYALHRLSRANVEIPFDNFGTLAGVIRCAIMKADKKFHPPRP